MEQEDKHIRKKHNVSYLLYHLVCPVKYRKKSINQSVERTIKATCLEITKRYEIRFIEIGVDEDHVHFLIQSIPILSPKEIAQIVKSILAIHIFKNHPEIKKMLWGGQFWTDGYYINTVGRYGNEQVIGNYVKNQGNKYKEIYREQLTLFNFN